MEEKVASIFKERFGLQFSNTKFWRITVNQDIKRHQIMMIWSFKRKQHLDVILNKYKARQRWHGGKQQWEANYWDTYSPIVSWSSIFILMTISKLHNIHTKYVDFVQAYTQAKLKPTIFLRLHPGIKLTDNKDNMVLKLIRNLYRLKDA